MPQSDKYIVQTEKPAPGGFMIARPASGPVIFVRGALPAEKVEITLFEQKRHYWRGDVSRVLEAHPQRIPSQCPAAAQGAGCCDFAFTSINFSRELKSMILRELLEHIAGYTWVKEMIPLEPSTTHWRLRARLSADMQGNIGMKAYRSPEIIPIYDCIQFDQRLIENFPEPAIKKAIEQLTHRINSKPSSRKNNKYGPHQRNNAASSYISATDIAQPSLNDSRQNLEFHIHILVDSQGERHITVNAAQSHSTEIIRVEGQETATMSCSGQNFSLSPTEFWQPHKAAATQYCDTIITWINDYHLATERIWDLYCGAGVYGSAIRKIYPYARIIGVDTSPGTSVTTPKGHGEILRIQSTVERLLLTETLYRPKSQPDNKLVQDLRRLFFSPETLPKILQNQSTTLATENRPQLIIADPPRKGLGNALCGRLISLAAPSLILIGCDMAAFTRDLAALCPGLKDPNMKDIGYHLADIRVYDAFPGTDHVECMALLLMD